MGKKSKKESCQYHFSADQLQVSGDNAVQVVEQAADAVALVEAWIHQSNADAISAVAWNEQVSAPVRKAAKRGINILKSRGVAIPERQKKPQQKPDVATFEAWFMPADAQGLSMYTIAKQSYVGQNLQIVQVMVHEAGGVVDVTPNVVAAGDMRDYFRRMNAQQGFKPASVPVDWARWRIHQAKQRNEKSGVIVPMAYASSTEVLEPVASEAPAHPIDQAHLAADETQIESSATTSGTLHEYPEFRRWFPEQSAVDDLLQHIGKRIDPEQAKLDNVQMPRELVEQEVASAADRYFTPEIRAVIANRMKDIALSVYEREGEHKAVQVLTVSEAVKRAGLITNPPSQVQFLSFFFHKALIAMASRQNGKLNIPIPTDHFSADEASKPIVAPAEALEQAAQTRRGRNNETSSDSVVSESAASSDSTTSESASSDSAASDSSASDKVE